MEPIAVYRRTIGASLARIWENVLDWEHLPWLHATSFLGVELLEASTEGWRAWVLSPPAAMPLRSLIDVRLQRDEQHYWTRTLQGFAAGTSIRTALTVESEHATTIAVEFFAPEVPAESAPVVGQVYLELYARLWDEDEAMMIQRQARLDDARDAARVPSAPIPNHLELGALAAVRARVPFVVGTGIHRVRVVEIDGDIHAHTLICPHRGGPLEDAVLCAAVVTCPWHGYRFDVRDGKSADGHALRLPPPPRVLIDASGLVALRWE